MAIHTEAPAEPRRSKKGKARFGRCSAVRMLVVGSCAMFAAVTPSHAGEIDAEVGYLASPVSLSVSGSQPVATYTVTLTNTSASNTINNGRLVATTTVVGGLSDAKAVFKSASGATCAVSLEGTRVDCSVDSLAIGQFKEFTLTFFSPSSGTSIDLAWDAVFDLGTPPGGSNGDAGTTTIALEAIDPTKVTSAVPPNETVSVFTGNFALPGTFDQFTVAITIPPVAVSTTATVLESDISTNINCTSLRNFKKCYQSSISIPSVDLENTGSYLSFVLSIDKSNIRNGSKIDKVLIQYSDGAIFVPTVQYCLKDGDNNPIPNPDKTPCIAKADDYTRKSPLGWFGFRWTIISLKNGVFEVF
jgi:hypothetical protein